VNISTRFQYLQQLWQDLWIRFQGEYLSQIVEKPKVEKGMHVKEEFVVLIRNEGKKRLEWPMVKSP
jgi:hypothetical protein